MPAIAPIVEGFGKYVDVPSSANGSAVDAHNTAPLLAKE
jgi:hypothetical protein